jgi:hypothetical protein
VWIDKHLKWLLDQSDKTYFVDLSAILDMLYFSKNI